MICINCGQPVQGGTPDFAPVHADGFYFCANKIAQLWLAPPDPDTALDFDECEAAGVDGTNRFKSYL